MSEPTRFGRYAVKSLLGRGAMGVVYKAEDPVISRTVAVKVIKAIPGSTEEDVAELERRFEREFRAAGTLTHPSIVTVYDVGQEGDDIFMAMEFVEGSNLDEQLGGGAELSPAQVADLADQIGAALDYAHGQGVVHRDVKPANIMLDRHERFKLTDFGIAKFQAVTLTRDGTQVGTPSYMSPEQVLGHRVTGASDQFSLAVVIYRLLTGERPFTGESMTAVMYQISQVDPPNPSSLNPRLSAQVGQVIMRALAKNPDDRFDDCTAFARALRQAIDGGAEGATVLAHMPPVAEDGIEVQIRHPHDEPDQAPPVTTSSHSTRLGLVAAGVIGSVVAGWLVWMSAAGGPSLIETTVSIQTTPPGQGLAVWLDNQRLDLSTPAVVPLEGEQGTMVLLQLTRDDEIVASTELALEPEMATTWEPVVEIPVVPVRYEVTSDPAGARVRLNGDEVPGMTPITMDLLPGQPYEIEIELDGHEGATHAIDDPAALAPGDLSLAVDLRRIPSPARIRGDVETPLLVRAEPTRGGRAATGRSDGGGRVNLSLPAGRYRVTFRAPQIFWSSTVEEDLSEGETMNLPARPRSVEVAIFDAPGNATVQIDDFDPFPTGGERRTVSVGTHRFRFTWPSGEEHALDVQITRDGQQVSARHP